MQKKLDDYLEKVERYLKPMPVSERIDIITEIRSEMVELETQNGLNPDQIIERLGDPKALAIAYLGDSITKNNSFSWKKLGTLAAFYSVAGLGSLFILPFTSILSVAMMFSAVISPLAGLLKFGCSLFGYDLPIVMMQFGAYTAPPAVVLPFSIGMGLLFYLAGRGLWKLTIKYVNFISQTKRNLQQPSGI